MKKSLRFSALALAMTLSVGASFPVSAATTVAQEGQPASINNASYASSSHISNFTFSRVPQTDSRRQRLVPLLSGRSGKGSPHPVCFGCHICGKLTAGYDHGHLSWAFHSRNLPGLPFRKCCRQCIFVFAVHDFLCGRHCRYDFC